MLTELLDLRVKILKAQSDRISAALASNMSDPHLHEEAAFLVGAFALREAAGDFFDTRPALCRMTAHLAFARALRGEAEPGPAGRYAEILLLALAERQAEAMQKLEALGGTRLPDEEVWRLLLRVRITGNWKLVPAPERASRALRLAHLRAFQERVDPTRVSAFLDTQELDDAPDWGRLTQQTIQGVKLCGFVSRGLETDLAEVVEAWPSGKPGLPDEKVAEALDVPPAPASVYREAGRVVVQVLDWGSWAAFEQRHLLSRLLAEDICYRDKWAQEAVADRRKRASQQRFGELRLYPLLAVRREGTAPIMRRSLPGAKALTEQHPEWVTSPNWNALLEKPAVADLVPGIPSEAAWFGGAPPFGTAYENTWRLYGPYYGRTPSTALYEALIKINPFDTGLRWAHAKQTHNQHPSHDVLVAAFGAMLEYHPDSMWEVVNSLADQPAAFLKGARQLCDTYIEFCGSLGDKLAAQHRDDEAAVMLRKWVDANSGTVLVSNNVRWLVKYYLRRHRDKEALEIARMAADVYSARGLEVLALVLEHTGDLEGAEEQLKQRSERYDNYGALLAFYKRQFEKFGQRKYRGALEALMAETFPHGIEQIRGP